MKLLLRVLLLAGAIGLAGCASPADKVKFDRQENGYFVAKMTTGAPLMTPPGVYSGPVLAIANGKLAKKIREMTGDHFSECVLVPKVGGYDVLIMTRERLAKTESDKIFEYVEVALSEAAKEADSYLTEARPNPESCDHAKP